MAGKRPLERWLDRLLLHLDQLDEIGTCAGIAASAPTARRVAEWRQANARAAGARAWVRAFVYESFDGGQSYLFSRDVIDQK